MIRVEKLKSERSGEVNQVAEKKVSPKAPAGKSAKSESKTAATRVTKKKLRKKIR
jgi:hypothetical protein